MKNRSWLFGAIIVFVCVLAFGCGAGAEDSKAVNPLNDYSAPNSAVVGSANGISVTKGELMQVMWMREAPNTLDAFLPLKLIESEAIKAGVTLSEADLAAKINEAVKRSNAASLQEVLKRFNMTEYSFTYKIRINALTELLARKQQNVNSTDTSKGQGSWYNNLISNARKVNNLKPVTDATVLANAWKGSDSAVVGEINEVKVTKGELAKYMWLDRAGTSLRSYLVEKLIEQAAVNTGAAVTQEDIDQKMNESVKGAKMGSVDQLLTRYNLPRERFVSSMKTAALTEKILRKQMADSGTDMNQLSSEMGKFSSKMMAIADQALGRKGE